MPSLSPEEFLSRRENKKKKKFNVVEAAKTAATKTAATKTIDLYMPVLNSILKGGWSRNQIKLLLLILSRGGLYGMVPLTNNDISDEIVVHLSKVPGIVKSTVAECPIRKEIISGINNYQFVIS